MAGRRRDVVAAASENVGVGVNVLAIIPARAGSTRIPRKNMAMLCGRPMLAWTLDAAIDALGALSVVLSSWDMLARNSVLCRVDANA